MKLLLTGMVYHPKWGGGEPKIAKSIYNYLSIYNDCNVITFNPKVNSYLRTYFSRLFMDLDPSYYIYNQIIRHLKPEIVLTFSEPSTSLFESCFKQKTPLILSLHIHWPYSYNSTGIPTETLVTQNKLNRIYKTILVNQFKWRKKRIQYSSGIVAASKFMKNEIIKNCEISESKVKVIYNGINPSEYDLSQNIEKEPLFLMLGPLTKYKGIEHFIKLSRKINDKKIKFAATGKPLYNVKSVDMLGYLSRENLIKYIHKSCAVVLPSLWPEPSSLIPLESMACGTPVIAYDSGGNSELIKDGLTGFIIKKGSIKLLSEKVLYLSQNIETSYKMGAEGKKQISNFYNVKRMGAEYQKYLSSYVD